MKPESGGFLSHLSPVVRALLIANVTIFFLDLFLGNPLLQFGTFTIQTAIFELRIWEFLTFQFLHGSLGHILFNSIGLYFFGPWMENWWGSKKFLIFYLLCGCAGAAFYTLLMTLGLLPGTLDTGLIGASAGIYGIFIGVAVIAPNLRARLLFPPIELSMRQLAIALMVISSGAIILKWGGNEGGEAGHLGGAILGFILVRYPRLLSFAKPREPKSKRTYEPKIRPRSEIMRQQDSDVDLILDKISREGFQSLSAEEREILQKAAQSEKSDS